ncbi:MAG: Translocation and assembly module subunit TamA [Chlamydiales bacterium]|nr:Translocation and assembly module subunit TamA [Chlamydiales bacterium]
MWRPLLFLFCLCIPAYAYQVSFEGDLPDEIFCMASEISQLESDKERPPPTLFTLKKRAESDKKTLIGMMHAYGYYESEITIDYLGAFPDTTVRLYFEPGPVYTFGSVELLYEEETPLYLSDLGLKIGCPARSDTILDTQEQIEEQIACLGYPMAAITGREVVVDQECKQVFVTYTLHKGPIAYFGPLEIDGLCKVRRGYIKRRIAWKEGELYNPQSVTCTETFLQESGLFALSTVRPADVVDQNGYLPMRIQVEEKKYRHIGAGVSYSTDESAGVLAQWSHDNLAGWGDALSLNGEYSSIIKRATLLYAMPDFFGRNQDLLYSAEVRREDAPGFTERELSLLLRINKKVTDRFSYSYGGRYERLLSTKSDNDANYNLLSAPIQVRWDTSNRLLNPTRGTTIAYFFTPYQAVFNEHISFLEQQIWGATYQPILPSGLLLLAGSAQLGSIVGQSRFAIPAPKRFYAGSSTGLRGYKYLSVSPLDGRKPIGGRSLFIGSIEPRIRIIDKLYFATFFDIGNVYAASFPRFNQKMLKSAGVGLRYLTPLGPFRIDIGFPLDKRKGIDKTFQIYASLGQTF